MPPLGDTESGFPYLTEAGRWVIKDVFMMGASIVTMARAVKKYLAQNGKLRNAWENELIA